MLHHFRKLLYVTGILFLSASAMETPSHPHTAAIIFQQAKIQANAGQLIREIPKLKPVRNDIYTTQEATTIIRSAVELFGGDEHTAPVPGFLERLEFLEKNLDGNHSLHGLANTIFELERAIELVGAKQVIKGFHKKIKLPAQADVTVKEAVANTPLELDIDLSVETQDGQMVYEKLKSFHFSSPKVVQNVQKTIDGLRKLKERTGIACRLHSKFTMPTEIQEYARAQGVDLGSDSPQVIGPALDKPAYPQQVNPFLINPKRIKINIPKKCIVCYEAVDANKVQFTRDLEAAYAAYLHAGLDKEVPHYDLRSWQKVFAAAKERFSLVPGFLKTILVACVSRMEEEKWCNLRTVLFELMGAFDAPEHKEVVAFGAELFYDAQNPTKLHDAPSFKVDPAGYKIQNKANVGFDLDVLLQEKEAPEKYSFIEATTGPSSVKCLEKFQNMGRALNAEVYVIHNFENESFERTAFWKHPACITLPNNIVHHLEWPIACRTQACLQELCAGKSVYQPIELTLAPETLDTYTRIHNKLIKRRYNSDAQYPLCATAAQAIEHAPYIFEELPTNINSIFKLIDDTSHQADEEVFRLKLKKGLEQLLEQEKENKRPGSIAFAILFLNQLNCTVHDSALRERYLAKKHQYSFDLNAVLASTLDMVIKKS